MTKCVGYDNAKIRAIQDRIHYLSKRLNYTVITPEEYAKFTAEIPVLVMQLREAGAA